MKVQVIVMRCYNSQKVQLLLILIKRLHVYGTMFVQKKKQVSLKTPQLLEHQRQVHLLLNQKRSPRQLMLSLA